VDEPEPSSNPPVDPKPMLRRIQRKQMRRARRNKDRFKTKLLSVILITVAVVCVLAMNRGCGNEGSGGTRQLENLFQSN
jgi:hypothetical protein